jgi:transaldolase
MSKPSYLKTQIFLDSGNPAETKQVSELLGFLDGQTTNPSLVAKNPHIMELKNAGSLTESTIWQEYKKVAEEIRTILPNGAISVEVYADNDTPFETMLEQGRKLAQWFEGVFVKLPITSNGLRTAQILVSEGINVNMTLCFSQDQAAAVHMATLGAKRGQVFVSPFIGRLDDIGINGLDLIKHISHMYKQWGSHVMVLGASVRNLEHLFYCFQNNTDIITAPLSVLKTWSEYGIDKNPHDYQIAVSTKNPITYKELIEQDWTLYNIHHELTDKGIEKFSSDWKNLFS